MKVKGILNNPNYRRIIGNFTYLSILQFAGYIFPLITIPYLAKTIGVTGFGHIAFAAGIVVWIQTIVDWGFSYTATREVARYQNDKEALSDIFSRVIWAKFLLMGITFIIFLGCIQIIPSLHDEILLFIFTFLLVPGHILFPDWFFQGIEQMKYITILNLVSKTIFTLLIFIVVKKPSDYLYQPLLTSLGYLTAGCISLILIFRKWGVRMKIPRFRDILETIKGSTNLFINQIFPNMYNSVGIVLLGSFHGSSAVGIQDSAWKITNIATIFFTNASRAIFPFFSRNLSKHKQYAIISITLSLAIAALLCLFASKIICLLYTPDFYSAIPILRIISISLIFHVIGNVYGVNYMILEGYESKLRNFTMVSSIIAFVVSIPLIYYYSYTGMALTFALGRFLIALFTFKFVHKYGREYHK